MGITEKEISTARYSLHFEQGRTPADTQYVATNMITVMTKQLDQVGRIIDTGLGAGANNINSLFYDLSDRSAAEAGALGDAVADARRQADVMAAAAGGRVGDLVELGTQQPQYRPLCRGYGDGAHDSGGRAHACFAWNGDGDCLGDGEVALRPRTVIGVPMVARTGSRESP